MARRSPAWPARHPQLPRKLHHLRHLQSPPIRLGQSSRRTPRCPSVPGVLWGTAVRLIRHGRRTDWTLERTAHMVKAMDFTATRIANGCGEGLMQGKFNALVIWTRNATSGDITIFNPDRTGSTHYKRFFTHLTNKTCSGR